MKLLNCIYKFNWRSIGKNILVFFTPRAFDPIHVKYINKISAPQWKINRIFHFRLPSITPLKQIQSKYFNSKTFLATNRTKKYDLSQSDCPRDLSRLENIIRAMQIFIVTQTLAKTKPHSNRYFRKKKQTDRYYEPAPYQSQRKITPQKKRER